MIDFPMTIPLGGSSLPLHVLFEALAFFCAGRLYFVLKRRQGDVLAEDRRWLVIGAAAAGAMLGSRLLAGVEHYPQIMAGDAPLWQGLFFGGRTIVGALLGGLVAVDITRWLAGIRTPSGDLMTFPLLLGIAVGRIGCFSAGVFDATHGLPTDLPIGLDMGDGIPRHATQLYEIAFLVMLAPCLIWAQRRLPLQPGALFKLFMCAYLGWRLGIDFLKPGTPLPGLDITAIQLACVAGLIWYAIQYQRFFTHAR